MSSFSFETTAGASQSTTKPRLSGNHIYSVTFDGCEIQDIKGVKDPDKIFKVLKIKFSNEDGIFEHTVFEPKPEDKDRGVSKYTDKSTGEEKTIPQPANTESMLLLLKHMIDAINPSIAKEIDNGTKKLGAKDWDGLRELVSKILNVGKGTTTKIKLLKKNTGEAQFPGFFASISQEGKAYIRNNFIGEKIAFTSYEKTRVEKEESASPTKISSLVADKKINQDTVNEDFNLDFDPIL